MLRFRRYRRGLTFLGGARLCGETFGISEELYDHFHEVFTPPDYIASDGSLHVAV